MRLNSRDAWASYREAVFTFRPRVAAAATLGMEFQSVSTRSGLRPLFWLMMSGSQSEASTDSKPALERYARCSGAFYRSELHHYHWKPAGIGCFTG